MVVKVVVIEIVMVKKARAADIETGKAKMDKVAADTKDRAVDTVVARVAAVIKVTVAVDRVDARVVF